MNTAILDLIQKLSTIFAFLVGGGWVLMNYLRNRTHVPRLQVEVNAELVTQSDRRFVIATCKAKNVGLSMIRLPKPEPGQTGLPGSALLVRLLHRFAPEPNIIEAPSDTELLAFDIFTSHRTIEPGLTISEQKLIYQPNPAYDAAWVQLRVSAHNEKWSAIAVAILDEPLS